MKIKGLLARVSVILAIFLSQSLADSSNEIDSNSEIDSNNELDSSKQVKKKDSAPPPFGNFTNPQKATIFGAGGFKGFKRFGYQFEQIHRFARFKPKFTQFTRI